MKHHYSVGYFFGQAFKGLWRNGVMSVASVVVLICCLVVMGVFAAFVANINENLQTLELANEVVVFLEYDATEEDAARVEGKIKALSDMGIGDVKFVSKEEALEEMREEYSEYAELFESIEDGDNPLAYSFEITVDDVSKGSDLQFELEGIDESVRKVSNRMDLAQQFENAKTNVTYAFAFLLAILFFVCVFVIINTVNLAVYARRNEIIVMRYVGATRWFIATPFVLEGVIIGVLSSIVSFFIEKQVYQYITSMMGSGLGLIRLIAFDSLANYIFWGFMAVGVFTGIIGSLISLRRRIEA